MCLQKPKQGGPPGLAENWSETGKLSGTWAEAVKGFTKQRRTERGPYWRGFIVK